MTQPLVQPAAVTTREAMRDAMRDAFLGALTREVPEAIAQLRALPAGDGGPAPDPQTLAAWADHWRVRVRWVLDAARHYYRDCATYPRHATDFRLSVAVGGWCPIEPPPLPAWDVYMETEAAFRARVDDYIRAVQRQIDEASYPDHLVPVRRDTGVFVRLVKFQVLGHTLRSIALADGLGGTSAHADVKKAITALAEAIDLPLRPVQRGRPRKL